ncbi:MAG: hypothetical protein WBD58_16595 [Geitlerinemataceae cyanobacterium]
MSRLSERAVAILSAEIKKGAGRDPASRIQRDILLKRLAKLRIQAGSPLTEAEIAYEIRDLFPDFSQDVIRRAAKANRPPGIWNTIKWATLLTLGGVGTIAFLNLPYPPIRRPVANVAPILLLPSFMQMDYHYREAIGLTEQADQLVNQATSAADFQLGTEKVQQAQKHLDALPVWFLGYEPRAYCSLMGCSWQFTLDEFKAARQSIARMEAKIFQEENAQILLDETNMALNDAKGQYQTADSTQQTAAIAAWQTAIDRFGQIPADTLAGWTAQTQLQTAQRDFQNVTGTVTASQRSNTAVEAAKLFAIQAATASQNPPHSVDEWENIAKLWQEAIDRLKAVDSENPGYLEAQTKLAEYTANLGQAQMRQSAQRDSVRALAQAKSRVSDWQSQAARDPQSPRLVSLLQDIVNELDRVQSGTTASAEAQELRQFAKNKLQALQPE